MLNQEEMQIVKKSLIHYFEILVKLSAEEVLPEITKTDLMNECTTLGKIRDKVETKTSNQPPYLLMLDNHEYNRVICSALKCYIKDLERSMEKTNGLYGEKVIPFNSTAKEIELVKQTQQQIQEGSPNTTQL